MAEIDEEFASKFAQGEAQRKRNAIQRSWSKIRDIATEIPCKWIDEPQSGQAALFEATIDGNVDQLVVEPEIRFGERTDKRPVSQYKAAAEKWALWKWHTARGTPVSEHDAYQTEPGYKAPVFVWEAEKRGPGRPRTAA